MYKVKKQNRYDSFSDEQSYEKDFYSFQEANSYYRDEIPSEERSYYKVEKSRSPWNEDIDW